MKLSNTFKVQGDYDAQGSASYAYDPVRGQITWNLNASAYGYPINQSGVYPLDKSLALSSAQKAGKKVPFGPLEIDEVSITGKKMEANMSMDDDTGTAQFDLSGEYLVLTGLQVTVSISLFIGSLTANIQLVEV